MMPLTVRDWFVPLLPACVAVWCVVGPARAVEPSPANAAGSVVPTVTVTAAPAAVVDPDVPEPFDPNVALHLLENPPFTRALNLSESLLLTGVAYVDGKPVATIKDMTTNRNYLVSDEPNAMGWKLAGASPSSELSRAEVQIVVGTEIVAVHYNESQLMPQKKVGSGNGRMRSTGYDPSHPPTPEEFTGKDDKGLYVRGMPYLSDADRRKMGDISRDTREKFLNIVHDNRERLFRASHDERANFVKKVFDAVTR